MTHAIALYGIALGKPTHSDVLIAIGGDDVSLIRCEQEGGEHGCMSKDEGAVGRVFVGGHGSAFRHTGRSRRCSERRFRSERIARKVSAA